MTRGSNRRDTPTSGQIWYDYSCPIETWEYWQGKEKFGQLFSPELRTDLAKALLEFRDYQKGWVFEKNERLDLKQIIRGLKAVEKTGNCPNPKLNRFIEIHCLDRPDSTLTERAGYLLKEVAANPIDFLMEHPLPNPLYTKVVFEIFCKHGFENLLGSTSTRYSMSKEARDDDPMETAFIEFVRRCIWIEDQNITRSIDFCNRIQSLISRSRIHHSL